MEPVHSWWTTGRIIRLALLVLALFLVLGVPLILGRVSMSPLVLVPFLLVVGVQGLRGDSPLRPANFVVTMLVGVCFAFLGTVAVVAFMAATAP